MSIQQKTPDEPFRLLKLSQVKAMIGVGSTTIYRWIGEGTFPAPIKLTEACARWRAEELEAWLELKALSRKPGGQ